MWARPNIPGGGRQWSDEREETEREIEVRGGILTVLTTVKDATAERLEGIFGWKK